MSDNSAANLPPLVSREQAGNAIGDALRLFVGRGRRYSVKQLSNGTGVKERVIECAMCDPVRQAADYRPLPLEALISISKFLGPLFTTEWLALAEQNAADAGPLDHEVIATKAIDYLSTKTAFHHPESECGPAIGPTEEETLDSKVVMFARVK